MNASDHGFSSDHPIHTEGICPALGALNDPETRFAYPSAGNFCHRVDPARGVSLDYQARCCLNGCFETCPVYRGETQGILPENLRFSVQSASLPLYRRWWIWLIGLLLIVGAILAGWLFLGDQWDREWGMLAASSETPAVSEIDLVLERSSTPQLEATLPPTLTATPLPTETSTPTPVPSETPQPSPTNTLPPTPGPGLGTPFGVDVVYVLHRVQDGQGFGVLSNLFDTNEAVIRAANVLREGRTIWPGDILIIPIGQKDPTQVTPFRYLFVEKKTFLEDLARQYSVSVEDIRRYNLLGLGDTVQAGRWLIIPAVDG